MCVYVYERQEKVCMCVSESVYVYERQEKVCMCVSECVYVCVCV